MKTQHIGRLVMDRRLQSPCLSLRTVARRTRISPSQLSAIERGTAQNASAKHLLALKKALKISDIEWLRAITLDYEQHLSFDAVH